MLVDRPLLRNGFYRYYVVLAVVLTMSRMLYDRDQARGGKMGTGSAPQSVDHAHLVVACPKRSHPGLRRRVHISGTRVNTVSILELIVLAKVAI